MLAAGPTSSRIGWYDDQNESKVQISATRSTRLRTYRSDAIRGPRRPPKDETVPRYWYQGGSLPRTLTIEPILLRMMIVNYLASFEKYWYTHTNSDSSA